MPFAFIGLCGTFSFLLVCKYKSAALVHYDTFVLADLSTALFALPRQLNRAITSLNFKCACCIWSACKFDAEPTELCKLSSHFSRNVSWQSNLNNFPPEKQNVSESSEKWVSSHSLHHHLLLDPSTFWCWCNAPYLLCTMNHHDNMIHHDSHKLQVWWEVEKQKQENDFDIVHA